MKQREMKHQSQIFINQTELKEANNKIGRVRDKWGRRMERFPSCCRRRWFPSCNTKQERRNDKELSLPDTQKRPHHQQTQPESNNQTRLYPHWGRGRRKSLRTQRRTRHGCFPKVVHEAKMKGGFLETLQKIFYLFGFCHTSACQFVEF